VFQATSGVFEYLGRNRFSAAASASAVASATRTEVYDPVESNARPSITGPTAAAAA